MDFTGASEDKPRVKDFITIVNDSQPTAQGQYVQLQDENEPYGSFKHNFMQQTNVDQETLKFDNKMNA